MGNREDMVAALACAAAGKVKTELELGTVFALNSILDWLQNGMVAARVVGDFVDAALTGDAAKFGPLAAREREPA